jgi:hypothetical protein
VKLTGQATPALAASGLVSAWQAGNRQSAATYADPGAVRAMFLIAHEPVQAAGQCEQDGVQYACAYFTKSGSTFFLRSSGSSAAGYRVTAVTTATD